MTSPAVETPAQESPATRSAGPWWPRYVAWFETLLIVAGLVGAVFYLHHDARYDGWMRADLLTHLMEHGSLPETSRYSIVGPFFAAPLWWIGKIWDASGWWVDRYNTVVLGAGILAIWLRLRKHVDPALLRKFFLLLVVGSMFTNHLRFFYGEVFTAVFAAVGIVMIVAGPRLVGWGTLILGVVNTPATLAGLGTMVAHRTIKSKKLRYALAVLVAGALILLINWIQRGDILSTGYEDDHGPETIMPYSGKPGLSNPLFFGLISLIFSFGKGLLFFAPGLFLPVRKTLLAYQDDKAIQIYRMWLGFLVGLVVIYSVWWSWHGGWFWGPRFLLFAAVPAAFALAVRLTHTRDASLLVNVATLLAVALSMWVGINGAVWGDDAMWDPCVVADLKYETPLCYYTPEFSVLWYPFVKPSELNSDQLTYLVFGLVVGAYLVLPHLVRTARQAIGAARDAGWLGLRYRF